MKFIGGRITSLPAETVNIATHFAGSVKGDSEVGDVNARPAINSRWPLPRKDCDR